ncbi:MAG TPA: nuclear transport factor 2 family protein [Vicinamibacteria bacterium]|nr:nuclear transport factor 2 family protein [Vicinamibacteria bacterium]
MVVLALAAALAAGAVPTAADLKEEVRKTETAFARTMADRDHAAFVSFLAEETVWFGRSVLRGKDAVARAWKPYYEGRQAPFSWRPETVEVLDSGTLALTSGPVFDPAGKQTATFTSIWRREADGRWRIIFDKGNPFCPPPSAPAASPSPSP